MACDGCSRTGEWAETVVNTQAEYADAYQASMKACLKEAMTSQCFRIRERAAPGLKPAEYLVSFILNVECYDEWVKPDGRNVLKSADLSVSLHYVGTGGGRELVHSWYTEKPERDYGDLSAESLPGESTGFRFVQGDMCGDRRSILKQLSPIELTVLNDFEKQPWECELDFQREEVYIGEEIEIDVINIKDIDGNSPREFNRIIIQAVEGTIVNGEGLEHDPALKAFKVGRGTVTFTYRAPDACAVTEDTIRVYRSCTIAREDQWPLSKSELDRDMTETTFKILCDRYEADIGVKVQWEEDEKAYKETGVLDVNISGIFEFWKEHSQGGITQYYPKDMTAKYSYDYAWIAKDPPSCKDHEGFVLKREESASDTMPVARSDQAPMAVHMKVQPMAKIMQENLPECMAGLDDLLSQVSSMLPSGLAEQIGEGMMKAGDFMTDRYEIMLTTGFSPPQTAKVTKTICKGDVAVKETDTTPVMDSFGLYINSKIDDASHLAGSRSWKSDSKIGANIYVNDLAATLGGAPLKPVPGDKVDYSVRWNLSRKTNQ